MLKKYNYVLCMNFDKEILNIDHRNGKRMVTQIKIKSSLNQSNAAIQVLKQNQNVS